MVKHGLGYKKSNTKCPIPISKIWEKQRGNHGLRGRLSPKLDGGKHPMQTSVSSLIG